MDGDDQQVDVGELASYDELDVGLASCDGLVDVGEEASYDELDAVGESAFYEELGDVDQLVGDVGGLLDVGAGQDVDEQQDVGVGQDVDDVVVADGAQVDVWGKLVLVLGCVVCNH